MIIAQSSFKGGMVESVKLLTDTTETALLLQNYNPFTENGATVKRWGEIGENIDLLYIREFSSNIFDIESLENNIMPHEALIGIRVSGTKRPEESEVKHIFVRSLITEDNTELLPETHDLYERQKKPYESSLIISYVPVYNVVGEIEYKWYNSFYEYKHHFKKFPGWYLFGTITNVTKYYDGLLLTSKHIGIPKAGNHKEITEWVENCKQGILDDQNNIKITMPYSKPLYFFKYWDVTKKRGDYEDGKYEKEADYWNGIDLDLGNKYYFTNWKIIPPVDILKLKGVGVASTIDYLDAKHSKKGILVIIGERDYLKHYNLNRDQATKIRDLQFVNTMEVFESGKINNKVDACLAAKGIEAYKFVRHSKTQIDYDGAVRRNIIQKRLKTGNIVRFWNAQYIRDHIGGDDRWVLWVTYDVKLIDYNALRGPRAWFDNDIIPMALTVEVRGTEYLLGQFNYTVKTETLFETYSTQDRWKLYNFEGGSDGAQRHVNMMINYSIDNQHEIHGKCTDAAEPDKPYSQRLLIAGTETLGENNIPGKDWSLYPDKYTYLTFTIKLTREIFEILSDIEATSINLYVSQPDELNSLLRSVNESMQQPTIYMKPAINYRETEDKRDIHRYCLVKKFVIEGRGEYVEDIYEEYERNDNFLRATNGWKFYGGSYYAVPQQSGSGFPETMDVLDELISDDYNRDIYGITPDFILYDYPAGWIMNLGNSGIYWEGIGAGLVTFVKDRPVIGNCIDKYGNEEVGRLRLAASKGTYPSTFFVEEDYLDLGKASHTALANYRDQLWAFTRTGFYRGQFQNPYLIESFELLDSQEGQGTFNSKTLTETPYGLVFLNESGVWYTDGRKPENLATVPESNILHLYLKLAINRPYIYSSINDIGNVPINKDGFNPYLEVTYDATKDELVIATPITLGEEHELYISGTGETLVVASFRLIYNFTYRAWRSEVYDYPDIQFGAVAPKNHLIKNCSTIERSFDNYGVLKNQRGYLQTANGVIENIVLEFGKSDYRAMYDYYFTDYERHLQQSLQFGTRQKIVGRIITHHLGDSINDFTLQKIILSCTAREKKENDYDGWEDFVYDSSDPQLLIYRRAKTYSTDWNISALDLVNINYSAKRNGAINPFQTIIQKPGGTNRPITEEIMPRESMILLAPYNSQFRQLMIELISERIMKVKSIEFSIINYRRR